MPVVGREDARLEILVVVDSERFSWWGGGAFGDLGTKERCGGGTRVGRLGWLRLRPRCGATVFEKLALLLC